MVERGLRSVDDGRWRSGEEHADRMDAPRSRDSGVRRAAPRRAEPGWASGDDSGLIDLKALQSAGEAEPEEPVMLRVPPIQVFPFGAPDEAPRAAPTRDAAPPAVPPPAPQRRSRMGNALSMALGAVLALAAVGVGYAAASLQTDAPTASLASD